MELAQLLDPRAYPHPVRTIRCVETHISWVLLTGDYAYKIKKPVRFSFVDFGTLERRRSACQAELRLNRRLAAGLYVDVVPIVACGEGLRVDAGGEPIVEWAVKMRQFAASDELEHCLVDGTLEAGELERFGTELARFHRNLAAAPGSEPFGEPDRVHAPAMENFLDLMARATSDPERECLRRLSAWTAGAFEELRPFMERRKRAGWIREGHGDLHLSNLVRWHGAVVAFDCIEFSPDLRWGDVISDAAFLVMDLQRRGRDDLAYRFLNAYLEGTGDYEGTRLLRYYVVYRALVRAKVAMIQRSAATGAGRAALDGQVGEHLALASRLAGTPQPLLVLMHGLSGSGKTWLSGQLAAGLPAVRIRSDVERKRRVHLDSRARTASPIAGGLYSAQASMDTYERLAELARHALEGGEHVIVDATFLARGQRQRFRVLAAATGAAFAIVDCRAPLPELRRRLEARAGTGDASEADVEVLDHQIAHQEPLQADEQPDLLAVDTPTTRDAPVLVAELRRRASPAHRAST